MPLLIMFLSLAIAGGRLVTTVRRALRARTDETDEDVFQIDRPGQLLSIRVGRKRTSAAPYYIRNQAEIDRLLETLVDENELVVAPDYFARLETLRRS